MLSLIRNSEKIQILNPNFRLDLQLHYTSKDSDLADSEEKIGSEEAKPDLASSIYQGRPDLSKILSHLIAGQPGGNGGVGVGVCGPAALGDSMEKLVQAVPTIDRKRVGGVELHAERFSL